ncbi:hypothetical protein ACF0H5_015212 [Mactra antiquata]
MVYCAAIGCTSSSSRDNVNFFRFPKDEYLKQVWIDSIGRKNYQPSVYSRVCSRHFVDCDFVKDHKLIQRCGFNKSFLRRLKPNAVPSLFPTLNPTSRKLAIDKSAASKELEPVEVTRKTKEVLQVDSTFCTLEAEKNLESDLNGQKSKELQQNILTASGSDKSSEMMASDTESTVYKYNGDINLDDIINSAIADLCNDDNDFVFSDCEKDVKKLESSIKLVERQQKNINHILSDCMNKLDTFKDTLEDEYRVANLEYEEVKAEADAAAKLPSEITIVDSDDEKDDDDDDDVQFIQKTYDPKVAIKRQAEALKQAGRIKSESPESRSPSTSQTRANLTAALSNAGNVPAPRTVETMRKIFSSALTQQSDMKLKITTKNSVERLKEHYGKLPVNSSLQGFLPLPFSNASFVSPPPLSSSSLAAQSSSSSSSKWLPLAPFQNTAMKTFVPAKQTAVQHQTASQVVNLLNQKTQVPASYHVTSVQNQERMEMLYLEDVNKIKPGSIVLTKRYSDIWHKGKVIDVTGANGKLDDRKYKVRYDQVKQPRTFTPRQTAFYECINKAVTVGTRIIALYKDGATDEDFYAGIVAEAPNGRNELRYLVFFDDGYAQYCTNKEIHKVFLQSKNVWEDIHPDSKDFIRDYLAQYPERPMVRLYKGQTVKTEWNGKWWTAKVQEVDASLALMYFPADARSEWIYRGSTRLEPLYTALANAEANRNTGKVKRHNLKMASSKAPVVEYTRNNSNDSSPGRPEKKKATARKSTTLNTGQVWESSWLKVKDKKPSIKPPQSESNKFTTTTISSAGSGKTKDMASVLQERLTIQDDSGGTTDLESLGTRLDHIIPGKDKVNIKMVPHKCSKKCLKDIQDNPEKMKGDNPLLIPLFFGWERHVAKTKPYGRRSVFYRAPCGRRLRTLEEIDTYIHITDSKLSIDNFCSDPELHVHHEFIPVKTFCDIKDISYGKENVVISCVNGIDIQYPDYVDYSNQRIPATGVKLNLDPEFLECCDCTDNCRDRTKCRCQQLTVETSAVINGGKPLPDVGYHHRRLPEPLLSGVYECNSRCKCDKRCRNRVVQNGLTNRLQVFKTERRGWGLRCLDDIPKGGFICIYAGQLLTDQGANEDGQQYGDEYLAELDYIEVVERQKEGYESDVEDIDEGLGKDEDDYDTEESDDAGVGSDSDESFTDENYKRYDKSETGEPGKAHRTRSSDRTATKQTAQKSTSSSGPSSSSSGPSSSSKMTQSVTTNISSTVHSVEESSTEHEQGESGEKKRRTGRSSGARYGTLNPTKKDNKEDEEKDDSHHSPTTRDYYQDDQSCYIMDAKSMGNIGRYLNHSCQPCAFVQNVFVDTHDLRFPWIAFFAGQYISAGTELTWDYNYEVGSVPGKVLYCYCGSAECRGRLL